MGPVGARSSAFTAEASVGSTRFSFRGSRVDIVAPDGSQTSLEIAYELGVDPLRQFVARGPRGRLQVLPIAWDSRPATLGGQRVRQLAELDEGSSLSWTGPHFNWNHACAECHATNLVKGYDESTDTFRTTFSEIDVSCEACHGPASGHLAWARAGMARAEGSGGFPFSLRGGDPESWREIDGRATRARVSTRPPPNEIDVCGRCHSRRRQLSAAYRHGASLLDTHLPELIDPPLYFPDGQIREEVYEYGSFLQSKMHRAGVTCSDCHEPHGLGVRAEGNALCRTCHSASTFDTSAHHHHASRSPGALCVSCHMPERIYMQVDARRDHSIRVPRPDLTVTLGVPNACGSCHADVGDEELAAIVARRRGGRPLDPHYGEILHRARSGDLGVAGELVRIVEPANASVIVRATAASHLGAMARSPDSARVGGALERALADPEPLVRVGALRSLRTIPWPARWTLAHPRLDDPVRAVRFEAALLAIDAPAPIESSRRAALDRAVEALLGMTALNADRADARELRARIYESRGRADDALREYQAALRADPRYWPVYINAADLLRRRGDERAALAMLETGIRLLPENADLHYARALALVRQRRHDDATVELATAARLAPNDPRFAEALDLALRASTPKVVTP